MTTWFTADTHFSHENIIRHCSRPFSSVGEMNLAMIERWNDVVDEDDVVYHLGDVAYRCTRSQAQRILDALHGEKHLIQGGHDWKLGSTLVGWASIRDLVTLRKPGQTIVVLCHYPLLSWWNMRRGSVMLHGHCHGTVKRERSRVDVGVDSWGFKPVKLEEVL